MIKLIVGKKGSGKTKTLVDMVNKAAAESKGNVICIEKGAKLTFDVKHTARLIDTEHYAVTGFDSFYGFLAGLFAGNYDITDIFIDNILKIGKTGLDDLGVFLEKAHALKELASANLVISVSADVSELPDSVKKYL